MRSSVNWGLAAAFACCSVAGNVVGAENPSLPCQTWPAWTAFTQRFISDDGRVIDPITPNLYTTSEGQSYGLFFALVTNQPERFALLLQWTENNLAAGDLGKKLPAWQWGKRADESWGVIDNNSASDADLWIAYALFEASRLWNNARYKQLATALAKLILAQETAQIPSLGLTLLPAPIGFHPEENSWRLNPSYSPIQVLRGLYHHTQDPQWLALIQSSQRLIVESAVKGFAPDWINFVDKKGWVFDAEEGSYNAIRSYLWAGMMANDDPLRKAQLDAFRPMVNYLAKHGLPPERVVISNGQATNVGPVGFSAAVLPLLSSSHHASVALEHQLIRLVTQPLTNVANNYYEQVLGLFAIGWINHFYHFDRQGQLIVNWAHWCE